MKIWILGSGSRGNAILLESGGSRVLVDAGFPPAGLEARLALIGVPPGSIEAVLVTHEHSDHARGACAAVERWGWPVHASKGTVAACPVLRQFAPRLFSAGATLTLGGLTVQTIVIPHDAVEPVALVITEHATGARAGIAYDLGHVSQAVRNAFVDLDIMILESNHDEAMLRGGPYPASVRRRIAGGEGHLSNRAAADMARGASHRHLGQVVLAHVSEVCNRPLIAVRSMSDALAPTAFRGSVVISEQDRVSGPISPGLAHRSSTQLSLGL